MCPSTRTGPDTPALYLRALIETCPIAIVVLDAQHHYTMCNPSFERLFQYTPNELASANLDSLIAGPERLEEAFGLSRKVLQGSRVHAVAQRRRRDGMIVDVEIYGIPLMLDGALSGVYGLYQDVTERNHAKKAVRAMADQLDNLQQEERRRIARELHDSTSQELAVLNWNLTRLRTLVGDGDEALKALVEETKEIAYQCSARIRSASYLLHPPMLGEAGLTLAIPWLAEGFEQRSGIRVMLEMSEGLGRYGDEVEIAVFRIVQEGLSNVMRHSGSAVVKISLYLKDSALELSVSDEGKGYSRESTQEPDNKVGVGIRGMRERVEQLGGWFKIESTNHGTTLSASVPVGMVPRG
ncbi:hypothetical protein BH10ACI4_BH10ACI4_04160 [soil metagenome]